MNKGELKPSKPQTDGRVICNSCHEFSGWTNDDLIHVRGDKSLKCQNCKKVCIEVKCQSSVHKDSNIIIEAIRFENEQRRIKMLMERGIYVN